MAVFNGSAPIFNGFCMTVGDSLYGCVSVCASVGVSTAKKTDMKYESMRELLSDYLSLFKKL